MDRINTRRAKEAAVGVREGVCVSAAVRVAANEVVAVVVDVILAVSVGDGVAVDDPGTLEIWQASRKINEKTMKSFLLCMNKLYR